MASVMGIRMGAVARKLLPLRPAGPDTVAALLNWYDNEARELPWRSPPGKRRTDPYRVWLSEIMLQQTTVKAVIPYYLDFLESWPNVRALAAANLDEVLTKWAGLGYYSRARNLHKCAQVIVQEHGGRFPRSERELGKLPGIGPYTAAAIAAIAFNEVATPVDGNIERVIARLFALRLPLPGAKKDIKRLASTLVPNDRPGDFAQAMMDLGATICSPKRPSCLMCPVQPDCHGYAKGSPESLPVKLVKPNRPTRRGHAFFALSEDGHILLRRRPEAGLLGGMMEVPSTDWSDELLPHADALRQAPLRTEWWPVTGTVTHTFTHFRLELSVYRSIVPFNATLTIWSDPNRCRWVSRHDLDNEALPSLMRKVITHALAE